MWADNETSEDLLGFKVHADLLIDVIKDDKVLPVTIGVFGDWGSGKSSILKIVNEELKGEKDELKDDTLVLYFNGWVFEGYDDAKAALLESIIKAFEEHKTIGNKVKDKTKKLLKSVKWMRALGFGFKKIILPTAAAYFTGGISLIPFLAQYPSIVPRVVI
ncbi:MAG TPA: P-loop NTPase fold protein [Bacteroidia bacterium]|nr:P-loop NTPase fold protein [Bacteroidia bacterium]